MFGSIFKDLQKFINDLRRPVLIFTQALKAALQRADNSRMVRQEKLSHIEGESPSRLNMHDNTKT